MYLTIAIRTETKDESTARELFKIVNDNLSNIPELVISGSVSASLENEET